MIRTPLALVPYALMAAAVGAGLLWHAGDMTARLGTSVATGTAEIGGPFALTDQDGKRRTDADFRGRFMLVYFGYSFCPDVCPTTLAMEEAALAKLGAKRARVFPVFITIDPARDTPAVLKTYLAGFGADLAGLTGDGKSIAAVMREYHVFSVKRPLPGGTYAMDHSSVLYLMDPNGRFAGYYEDQIGPDGLAADLRKRL